MQSVVLTIHIIACITLVLFVLLQSGKEGMGVIFGGGSSSLFGSSGAGGFLAKVTAGAAIVFLTTSLSYTYLISHKHRDSAQSAVKQQLETQGVPAPTAPIPTPDEQSQTAPAEETSQAAPETAEQQSSEPDVEQPVPETNQ